MALEQIYYYVFGFGFLLFLLSGIRIVRPIERGIVERLGKPRKFVTPGFNWIIPLIDKLVLVNITETLVNAEQQEIITSDSLNAVVDAQVYYKIREDKDSVLSALYKVNNVQYQIVQLARTTLRNIIGGLTLVEANSDRTKINDKLLVTLKEQTTNWGVDVVRTELKEINPPREVQDVMNKVVVASNEKTAAIDFATAIETKADGAKRAAIKEAEGEKQAVVLKAEGEAQAIQLVNEAAQEYFKDAAVQLKQLEVVQASLEKNAKIIITKDGINPLLLLGDLMK